MARLTHTTCAPRRKGASSFALAAIVVASGALLSTAAPQRFYIDDPISRDHDTEDAAGVQPRGINLVWDELHNLVGRPGDRVSRRALNVNSIDEVPDSAWFTNRVGTGRLTPDDVRRGPNRTEGPSPGPWTVVAGKSDGVTPGFTIRDEKGITWFIKFDPPSHHELATGAEIVSTKLFWALGYNVPENHIGTLRPADLRLNEASTVRSGSHTRRMRMTDVRRLLRQGARNRDGSYRVLASRALDGRPLGGFLYYGTRPDDPNDVVPHEHRRELRALRVFGAWLNHVDSKSINSLDTLVEERGHTWVKHHLIDFGSTLGSAAVKPREYDEGHEYIVEPATLAKGLLPLGLYLRRWRVISYPSHPSIGHIEGDYFDPNTWKPRVPNAAHQRARSDDTFWAARQVVAVTDQMVRAAVDAASYSNSADRNYLIQTLIKRRDRVAAAYLSAINPVITPTLDGTLLRFRNAAVDAGVAREVVAYDATWYRFDNVSGRSTRLGAVGSGSPDGIKAPGDLPQADGEWIRVDVAAAVPDLPAWAVPVRVYFHRRAGRWHLVGLERLPEDASGSAH